MDDNEFKVGAKVLICQGDPEEFCERTGIYGDQALELSSLSYLTVRKIVGSNFQIEEDGGYFTYSCFWVDSIYHEPDLFEVASDEELVNLFLE